MSPTRPGRALLDVNALVALAWDSHVHHAAVRRWFAGHVGDWATCPSSEAGFVRVSANPVVLPNSISVDDARRVLEAFRAHDHHRFYADDVSMCDPDLPVVVGHRQVADAQLLTVARRHGASVVTFDRALWTLAGGRDVEVLSAN